MASGLAMGTKGEHTSPTECGTWGVRKVLDHPPPLAPSNVLAIGFTLALIEYAPGCHDGFSGEAMVEGVVEIRREKGSDLVISVPGPCARTRRPTARGCVWMQRQRTREL
jgi:hypothetical protein